MNVIVIAMVLASIIVSATSIASGIIIVIGIVAIVTVIAVVIIILIVVVEFGIVFVSYSCRHCYDCFLLAVGHNKSRNFNGHHCCLLYKKQQL